MQFCRAIAFMIFVKRVIIGDGFPVKTFPKFANFLLVYYSVPMGSPTKPNFNRRDFSLLQAPSDLIKEKLKI